MGSCAGVKKSNHYLILKAEPPKGNEELLLGKETENSSQDFTTKSTFDKVVHDYLRTPASPYECSTATSPSKVSRSRAPTATDQDYKPSPHVGPDLNLVEELQIRLDRHVCFLKQASIRDSKLTDYSEDEEEDQEECRAGTSLSSAAEVVSRNLGGKVSRSRCVSDYSEIVPWNSPTHSPDDGQHLGRSPNRPRLETTESCKTRRKVPLVGWILSDSLDEINEECEAVAANVEPFDSSLASCGRRLYLQHFSRGPNIGSGSFGTVFAARHQGTGQIVAVKEVFLERRNGERLPSLDKVMVELSMCKELCHHRIVGYLGYDIGPGEYDGGPERLFLFLEHCSGGSIASHLSDYGKMQVHLFQKYALQLMEGLDYLHTRQPPVIHRDLKCANLLLTAHADLKITDFGCSKMLTDGAQHHSIVGSILWMAPELLKNHDGVELATCSDIWSYGCCLLEMATGTAPWSEKHFDNFLHAWRFLSTTGETPEIPSHLKRDAAEFTCACLVRDPVGRSNTSQLHQHSFLIAARKNAQSDFVCLT